LTTGVAAVASGYPTTPHVHDARAPTASEDATGPPPVRRIGVPVIDWLFRDRRTGRITVAQVPNLLLITFLVAEAVRLIARPSGTIADVVDVVASLALIAWAVDEIVRGVNPWRRILGSAALAWVVVDLLLS